MKAKITSVCRFRTDFGVDLKRSPIGIMTDLYLDDDSRILELLGNGVSDDEAEDEAEFVFELVGSSSRVRAVWNIPLEDQLDIVDEIECMESNGLAPEFIIETGTGKNTRCLLSEYSDSDKEFREICVGVMGMLVDDGLDFRFECTQAENEGSNSATFTIEPSCAALTIYDYGCMELKWQSETLTDSTAFALLKDLIAFGKYDSGSGCRFYLSGSPSDGFNVNAELDRGISFDSTDETAGDILFTHLCFISDINAMKQSIRTLTESIPE